MAHVHAVANTALRTTNTMLVTACRIDGRLRVLISAVTVAAATVGLTA